MKGTCIGMPPLPSMAVGELFWHSSRDSLIMSSISILASVIPCSINAPMEKLNHKRLLLCCFSDDMLERGVCPSVYFEDETFENNQYSQYSAEPTLPYVIIMENPMV